jgi:hypothetical protein
MRWDWRPGLTSHVLWALRLLIRVLHDRSTNRPDIHLEALKVPYGLDRIGAPTQRRESDETAVRECRLSAGRDERDSD